MGRFSLLLWLKAAIYVYNNWDDFAWGVNEGWNGTRKLIIKVLFYEMCLKNYLSKNVNVFVVEIKQ